MCRACASSADNAVCAARSAATPYCATGGPSAGQCVQCTTATQAVDCTGNTPICGSDGTCRKCAAHAECPSAGNWGDGTAAQGVCVFDGASAGSCAPSNKIAYVDNGGHSITACKGDGNTHDGSTPAKAYCDVQDAVGGTQPFIVVKGNGNASYGGASTGGTNVNVARDVTVVGPGGSAATTAQISSGVSATPCISVGSAVTVVVDGFELGQSSSGIGLACTGVNTVLIARRNSVHSAGGGGVNASNCTLTLDGNDIENNAPGGVSGSNSTLTITNNKIANNMSGGVSVSSSTIVLDGNYVLSNSAGGVTLTTSKYTLTNNIIGLNGNLGGGYGVKFNDSPTGSVFAFNTVARNASDGNGPPGIVCNAGATIQSSIVAQNSPLFMGSQVTKPGCMLTNVVTGTDNASGANMSPPAFKSTTDFHLDITGANEAINKTCCIDQLTAPGTPNSDHDVDFSMRPKGTGPKNYDIGAHEAE
jgi:hypothetical protein